MRGRDADRLGERSPDRLGRLALDGALTDPHDEATVVLPAHAWRGRPGLGVDLDARYRAKSQLFPDS